MIVASYEPCSLNTQTLRDIFDHAKPLGHYESAEDLNLGFGYVYYGLVRALRPEHIVVIGSGYGFSVTCLALGLKDNQAGRLTFVDPSYSVFRNGPLRTIGGRDNWSDPQRTREHFARFEVEDIVTHHKLTAAEFFTQYDELELPPIDLAFVDGNHAYAHVKHDFEQSVRRCRRNSYVLLHDTNIYMREMVRHAGVKRYMKKLRKQREAFELVDFPFSSGVAIVRVKTPAAWETGA